MTELVTPEPQPGPPWFDRLLLVLAALGLLSLAVLFGIALYPQPTIP